MAFFDVIDQVTVYSNKEEDNFKEIKDRLLKRYSSQAELQYYNEVIDLGDCKF